MILSEMICNSRGITPEKGEMRNCPLGQIAQKKAKPKKVDITKCLVHMKGEACPGIDSKKCLNMKQGIPCPTHPHITKYLKPKKDTPDLRSLGEKILEKVGMGSHTYSDLEYNLKTDKYSLKPAVQQLVKDGRLKWMKNKLVLPEREKPVEPITAETTKEGIVVKVPEKTLEHIEKGGEAPETVVKESRVRICSFEVLPAKEEPTPKIVMVQKSLLDYPLEA